MRTITILAAAALAAAGAAQDEPRVTLALEARGDYQREYAGGEAVDSRSGFKGQYLNLRADGTIAHHWTYSLRHRMNKTSFDSNFFDATDWLHIDYSPDERWTLSGGKQVVAIGGWEYDRAPIDLYFCSEFWNQVPCYSWGASVTRRWGSDELTAQFCQSPFDRLHPGSDTYAYNLLWRGRHGCWTPLWSVNALEWRPGRFISYVTLGNALDLGRVRLELDLMNRASSHQAVLLRDCSVMAEGAYRASGAVKVFVHGTYDVNSTHTEADLLVRAGTELWRLGGGVEWRPVKGRDIRLHATYCYSWGTNTNPDGATLDRQHLAAVGATWKVNLLTR